MHIRSACLAAVFTLTLLCNAAFAAPTKFDIPAQPAPSALMAFSKQARVEVVFAPDDLKSVRTPAVQGEFEPEEALALLLHDSGFVSQRTAAGKFVITRQKPKTGSVVSTVVNAETGKPVADARVRVVEATLAATTDRAGQFRLDGLPPGAYSLVVAGEAFSPTRVTDVVVHGDRELTLDLISLRPRKDGVTQLEEYVVSARKDVELLDRYVVTDQKARAFTDANVDLPRSVNDPQAYYIFSAPTIEQSGATNIEEFLRQRLTMNTTMTSNSQLSAYNAPYSQRSSSTIALRGLSATQTLILVNGRRLAGVTQTGANYQPDLNGLPLSSIERIEVLPSSASGIYGGGAVGGVINVITKRDYTGGEVRVTYDNTFSTDSPVRTVEALVGLSLENGRTQLSISGHLQDSSPLLYQDRPFLKDYFIRAVRNNPAAFTSGLGLNYFSTATGMIIAANGNLAGTHSNFVIIPPGYQGVGVSGTEPLVAAAGQLSFYFPDSAQQANGLRQELDASKRNKSIRASLSRQMTRQLELFTEAFYTDDYGYSQLSVLNGTGDILPATSPGNPFNQPVTVNWESPVSGLSASHNYTRNITVGFRLKLPHDWTAMGDYTWNESLSTSDTPTYDFIAFDDALMSGAINPFRDTHLYPVDVQPYLTHQYQRNPATTNNLTVRASGPVWTLPGGDVILAASAEHRKEGNQGSYQYIPTAVAANTSGSYSFGEVQNITAGYVEMSIPLVGPKNSLPGLRSLELQVAGRKEYYEVKVTRLASSSSASYNYIAGGVEMPVPPTSRTVARYNSANPTLGLAYKPVQDAMLRFSTATAFSPPIYSRLIPGILATRTSNVRDPKRGNVSTAIYAFSGGNPDLKPETARTLSAGLVLTPRFAPKLRLSVDYTQIKKRNNITSLSAQQIVDNEALYPDRVTRGAVLPGDTSGVGPITRVNTTALNLYRSVMESFDATIGYQWDTPQAGTFDFSAMGTWQPHSQQQTVFNAPLVEYAGFPSNGGVVRFQANGTLTWEYHRWTAGWTTRYIGAYNQYGPPNNASLSYVLQQGGPRVPSQIFHDVFVGYRLPRDTGRSGHWAARLLDGLEVQVGVKDVFNTKPAFDAYYQGTFYVSPLGDLRMAEYHLSVRKPF